MGVYSVTRVCSQLQCCVLGYKGVYSVAGCVRLQDVFGYRMCGCRMCSVAGCVQLHDVFGYMMCSVTGCVWLQDVFGYMMCSVTGLVRLQDVFGYRMCLVAGGAYAYDDQDTSSDSDDEVLRRYQQTMARSQSTQSYTQLSQRSAVTGSLTGNTRLHTAPRATPS